MNQESPFEKLDKLYRMLLAPTTFLILISWHYTVYLTNVGMDYPQYTLYTIDPSTALFAAPVMAMVGEAAIPFIIIISFLNTFWLFWRANKSGNNPQ